MKPGPKPTLPQVRRPGIYAIVNLVNGKVYVGSAVSITGRLNTHRKALRRDRHENIHLQAAWNKYGESAFELRVLEECDAQQLVAREQFYIDSFRSADRMYGYNKCPAAGTMFGFRHSDESKKKMSESRKGKPLSEGLVRAAAARAEANRGKPLPKACLDAAAVVNRVLKKVPKADEHRARIGDTMKAVWATRKRRQLFEKQGRAGDGTFGPRAG